jgi:uncharacterized protein YabN with tetrapyrrole methylase and pyrophosphatase domain
MKKAIVRVIAVQGAGKSIFKAGETVLDVNFPVGNFDELVKSGHLELTKVEKPTPKQIGDAKKAVKAAEEAFDEANSALEKASDEEKEQAEANVVIAEANLKTAVDALNDMK